VHTLKGGETVALRMIRPTDRDALRDAIARLSPESRYRRFLGLMGTPSEETLRYLTEVDGVDHVAIVATRESLDLKDEEALGVGRFVRLPDARDVAEAAVTVGDWFQGRGLGMLLLTTLAEAASERGIRKFRGEVLASNAPSQLTLQFVRDVDASDLTKAWTEGFEKSAKGQLPALKDRIATLNGWMTAMKTGQRLTFTDKPGTGVEVNVNGAVKGTIKGDDFAKALLAIWLGPDPPNPEIKSGLLGGACG